MKKILTIFFIFILCTTWSFAQCTLGTTAGSECTLDADGTITMPTVDGNGDPIETLDIVVKAWGAGGSSNTGGGNGFARGGGGGGAYYTNTYTVVAGTAFTIIVGQPITANMPGGSSIFDFGGGIVDVGGGNFGGNSGNVGGTVTGALGAGTAIMGGAGGNRSSNTGSGGGGGGSGPMAMDGEDGTAAAGGAGGPDGGTDGGVVGSPGGTVTLPGGGAGGTGSGLNLGINSGGVGRVMVCFSSLVVALPVELISFDGTKKDRQINLNWKTASEINNDGFQVERGIKTAFGLEWNRLDFINGNGTTQIVQSYSFIDENPEEGTNYYRLKQMDFDGQYEYSSIIAVEYTSTNGGGSVGIFPNPIKDQLTLTNGKGKATIFNVLGQPVKNLTIDASQTTIQLGDLLNGQYYLQLLQENGTVITKSFSKEY